MERAAMFFGITTNKKVLELDVFELDFAVLRLRPLFYVPVLLEDVFHGISNRRRELLEILGVDEDLVLLVAELWHLCVAGDNFLAFCQREIHVIAAVLFHIDVINSFSRLDGAGEEDVLFVTS